MTERKIEPAEDEYTSDSNTCPECGHPIENVRRTCPNCGQEYADDQYDQEGAGHEFTTGSNIDDSGEEIVDEGAGAG